MLRTLFSASLLVVLSGSAFAQTEVFEAATVKPSNPNPQGRVFATMGGGPGTADPQRLTIAAYTMDGLLRLAFAIPFNGAKSSDQISGPSWLNTDKFDIVANIRPGATQEQVHVMLQNLLIERFSLKFHRETHQVSGYELTMSKGGAKLKPTDDPEAVRPAVITPDRVENSYPVIPPGVSAMRWFVVDNGLMHGTGRSQSINELIVGGIATYLRFEAPIVDRTGLTGKYDFHLDLALDGGFRRPGGPPLLPDEPVGPDIFSALDKQLGLKLEKKQVPVETLVIDRIEKTPADN